jgi:hypothetical protein
MGAINDKALDAGLMNASKVRGFVKFAGHVPAPLQDYINYQAAITTKASASPSLTINLNQRNCCVRRAALESSPHGATGEVE